MQRWVIGLAVAGVLTGAKMMRHASAAPADPASRAAMIATGLQAMTPKTIDNALTITGASAEGRTLTMSIRFDRPLPSSLSIDDFSKAITAMACKQPTWSDFIQTGGTLRWDLVRIDGSTYNSIVIDHCAANAG